MIFEITIHAPKVQAAATWAEVREWLRENGLRDTYHHAYAQIQPPYHHGHRFDVWVEDDALALVLKMRWQSLLTGVREPEEGEVQPPVAQPRNAIRAPRVRSRVA